MNAGEALDREKKLAVGLGIVSRPTSVSIAVAKAAAIARAREYSAGATSKIPPFRGLQRESSRIRLSSELEGLDCEGEQTASERYEEKNHGNLAEPHTDTSIPGKSIRMACPSPAREKEVASL